MLGNTKKAFSKIEGSDVAEYFHRYATKYDLLRRCRFDTSVVRVARDGPGWEVYSSRGEVFRCDKLIVSTGLNSKPRWPAIPNVDESFGGPIMHSKSLGTEFYRLTDSTVKQVVVIGGCKSAIEAAMLSISAGKFVHWIIRPEGTGAGMIIVTDKNRPNICALNVTRAFNSLTPSVFATEGFWYHFLHSGKSRLGRKVNEGYWKMASKIVFSGPKYDKSQNGKMIRPKTDSVFWNRSCISIIDSNGPFLEFLHDESKLKVHHASVTHLSGEGVHLSTGDTIAADAVLYATGWEKAPSFFAQEDIQDLGLPISVSDEPLSSATHWASRDAEATARVNELFPGLAEPPKSFEQAAAGRTPYRLYRNIIPPNLAARGDRSIAFTGMLVTSQTVFFSGLSALYAVAYLEDMLPTPLPSLDAMETNIGLVNAWMKARYGARGVNEPLNLCEQSFFDTLCRDLGIDHRRKKGVKGLMGADRWFWEWFGPYTAKDYKGFVSEFLEASKARKTPGKLSGESTPWTASETAEPNMRRAEHIASAAHLADRTSAITTKEPSVVVSPVMADHGSHRDGFTKSNASATVTAVDITPVQPISHRIGHGLGLRSRTVASY